MSSQGITSYIPVDLTVKTGAGSLSAPGRMIKLEQTAAQVVLQLPPDAEARESFPFFGEQPPQDLQVAVVVKGDDDGIIDIVPAWIMLADHDEEGLPRLTLEFARDLKQQERRKAQRLACNLPVTFRPLIYQDRRLPDTGKLAGGRIVDLSATGAKLTTSLRLPQSLTIEIWLQTRGKRLRLLAEVVNVQVGEDSFRYGLRFARKLGEEIG